MWTLSRKLENSPTAEPLLALCHIIMTLPVTSIQHVFQQEWVEVLHACDTFLESSTSLDPIFFVRNHLTA